jgi:hypothetical protein
MRFSPEVQGHLYILRKAVILPLYEYIQKGHISQSGQLTQIGHMSLFDYIYLVIGFLHMDHSME